MKRLILLFSISLLNMPLVFSQDTLIIHNNYKWKIGGKLISERSQSQNTPTTIHVFSGGFQALYKLGSTKSCIESGIYLRSLTTEYYADYYNNQVIVPFYYSWPIRIKYYYLSLPVYYRLNTRLLYLSGGVFADYLIKRIIDNPAAFGNISNYGEDRKFRIGYGLNVGIEKEVSKHINLLAEARSAVTISSDKMNGGLFINHGNLTAIHLNYGVALGANYKFLK